jgi:hypothetical protein
MTTCTDDDHGYAKDRVYPKDRVYDEDRVDRQ